MQVFSMDIIREVDGMSKLTMLQKNGITNMVCKNEDCHTPETNCPCTIIDQCECPTLKEVIETLAHYKDLEEQGRLVVLPCLPNEKV